MVYIYLLYVTLVYNSFVVLETFFFFENKVENETQSLILWLSQHINHDKFSQPVAHMEYIMGKLVKLPESHLAWSFGTQTAELIYN